MARLTEPDDEPCKLKALYQLDGVTPMIETETQAALVDWVEKCIWATTPTAPKTPAMSPGLRFVSRSNAQLDRVTD